MRARRDVRALFLRNLGATWFLAFRSLRRQLLGLYGERGLAPLRERLESVEEYEPDPKKRQTQWPSLLWLGSSKDRGSDRALVRLARVGEASGALLALGIAPRWTALTAWASYLSFVSMGDPFLSYQWDALLLEAGLQSVLLAPDALTVSRSRREPSVAALVAMSWLAARLHLEAGLVKLQSQDETWRALTACGYHHATQPLPTPLGWYANQLGPRAQKASTLGVLGIELGAPVLALLPRPIRQVGAVALLALQAAIAISGNYGFFNLLSAQLCLWLLDDGDLRSIGPRQLRDRHRARRKGRPSTSRFRRSAQGESRRLLWREVVDAALFAPVLAVSVGQFIRRFRPSLASKIPTPVRKLGRALRPLRIVNPYGLFAVMTTTRPEIVIEGSDDGEHWRAFELPFKATALNRRPRFTGAHMPRLDWQLWFAALGSIGGWLETLLVRLLEGTPEVYALLDEKRSPFRHDAPPKYVRATLYDYRMTTFDGHRATGRWWDREVIGRIARPFSLAQVAATD